MYLQRIDDILAELHRLGRINDSRGKGTKGEEAALAVILRIQSKMGGIVFHSYKYPYQKDARGKIYTGNIKKQNGELVEYTGEYPDEIDVIYITAYRIFLIEVKAYHDNLRVYDHWMSRKSGDVEESPILQCEKHARHFYHAMNSVIPEGNPNYIIPIVCFVDRCVVRDERSDVFAQYVPVVVLDGLKKAILELNTPLKYNLDFEAIKRQMDSKKISVERIYG